MAEQVRCPNCGNRLCDRTPSGIAAGHYRCKCKLEIIVEYVGMNELQLVVVPPEMQTDLAPVTVRRLTDGRGLVRWEDYKVRG